MPKLNAYQSTQNAPQGSVSDSGAGAFGRNIEAPLAQFGSELVNFAKRNEATKLTTAMSEAQAALTIAQEKAFLTADPNDEEVASRFMEAEVTPLLDKIGDSLETHEGRQMYERARAGMMSSFAINGAAKQANLSGIAEQKNFTTTTNNLSNAAKTNPGQHEQSIALARDYETGVRLRGVVDQDTLKTLGKNMRREIAMGTITGMADKGQFAQARAMLASDQLDEHIDASDKETLEANIRTAEGVARSEAESARVAAAREQEATFATAQNNILNKQPITKDGLGLYAGIFKDAQDLEAVTPEQVAAKRAMINYAQALVDKGNGDTWREDKPTLSALWGRAYKTAGDPDRLTVAEVHAATGNRLISPASATNLLQAITGEDDPTKRDAGKDIEEFIKQYTSTITKSGGPSGVIDTTGNQRWGEFEEQARLIFRDGLAQGVPQEEIKRRILSTLPRYQRSADEIIDSLQAFEDDTAVAPLARVAPQRWVPNAPMSRGFPGNLTEGAGPDVDAVDMGIPEGMIQPAADDDKVQNPFDFNKYPPVQNADGSMSHIITKSWGFTEKDADGKLREVHVLLPTMIGGKKLTDEQAQDHYLNTGEYFRKFETAEAAQKFAAALEREMQFSNTQRGTPAAQRAKPNETPAQYLKRLGLQ